MYLTNIKLPSKMLILQFIVLSNLQQLVHLTMTHMKDQNLLSQIFLGISTRNRKQKNDKENDSYHQFTEWMKQIKKSYTNDIYSQEQIFQIRDYIELTEGIELTKKSERDSVYFRCRNFDVCSFYIEFQKVTYKQKDKLYFYYKVRKYSKKHREFENSSQCFLTQQELTLFKRKKYLRLIRPTLKQILSSDTSINDLKNPTQVMEILQKLKNEQANFFYKGLNTVCKRQLKKAFDNAIGNIKHQITTETKKIFKSKKHIKKAKKAKKIRKTNKFQVKIQYESQEQCFIENNQNISSLQNEEKHELKMIQEDSIPQKSENQVQKCFNEVKIEQICQQIQLKQKVEANIYLTPTKKKNKMSFDLQKSSQKRPSTYDKSYQQHLYLDSMQKKKQIFKSDSDSDQKISSYTPIKSFIKEQKQLEIIDFQYDIKQSISESYKKGLKDINKDDVNDDQHKNSN